MTPLAGLCRLYPKPAGALCGCPTDRETRTLNSTMTKPATPPSKDQLALLRRMADRGVIVVGILGADALHPNQRIFFTSDGDTICPERPKYGYRTINGLETRGLIRVISTSGEDPPRLKYLVITEAGRLKVAPSSPSYSVFESEF